MPKPQKTNEPNPPDEIAALRAKLETIQGDLDEQRQSDEQRAQELAQELVYHAMEASSSERCLQLLRQALELDPENLDALLMMVDAAGLKGEKRIEVLRGIVTTGAKRLGKKAFKELVPHFWGFIETRPYMRARERLAEALRSAGRLDEATSEYEEMLTLNEGDNQGIRYLLLPLLLAQGRLDDARALLDRYKDECDWSVVIAWGRVLERVLSQKEVDAVKALAVARKQNGHMEAYLKGHRKTPKNLPGSYTPGSKEEALCYVDALLPAWVAHPVAVDWLIGQTKP